MYLGKTYIENMMKESVKLSSNSFQEVLLTGNMK